MKRLYEFLISIIVSAPIVLRIFAFQILFSPDALSVKIIVMIIFTFALALIFFIIWEIIRFFIKFFRRKQEPNLYPEVTGEKGVGRGIINSLIVFIVCWLFFYIIKFYLDLLFNGLGLEVSDLTIISITHPFLYACIESAPFLFFNSIFCFFARKNRKFRNGFFWGYLFIIIFFIFGAVSAYNVHQLKMNQQQLNQAMHANNISSCDNFSDLYTKDTCLENVALNQKDPSICSKIVVETKSGSPATRILKDNCYQMAFGVAIEKGDASICTNYITDNTSLLNYCKSVVSAVAGGDYSCDQVKDYLALRDYCVTGVVKNINYQKMVSQGVWKTYSWNSYVFSYPPDWTVAEMKKGSLIAGLYFKPFYGGTSGEFISIDMASCGSNLPGKCVYYHNTMTVYTPSTDEQFLKIFDQFIQKIK